MAEGVLPKTEDKWKKQVKFNEEMKDFQVNFNIKFDELHSQLASIYELFKESQKTKSQEEFGSGTSYVQQSDHRTDEFKLSRQLKDSNRYDSLKIPKLDFPTFDGVEPREWIRKCEHYFLLHAISDDLKIRLGELHLKGKAELWLIRWKLSNPSMSISWESLKDEVCNRFDVGGLLIDEFEPPSPLKVESPEVAHKLFDEMPSPPSIELNEENVEANDSGCKADCSTNMEVFDQIILEKGITLLLDEMFVRILVKNGDDMLSVPGSAGNSFRSHLRSIELPLNTLNLNHLDVNEELVGPLENGEQHFGGVGDVYGFSVGFWKARRKEGFLDLEVIGQNVLENETCKLFKKIPVSTPDMNTPRLASAQTTELIKRKCKNPTSLTDNDVVFHFDPGGCTLSQMVGESFELFGEQRGLSLVFGLAPNVANKHVKTISYEPCIMNAYGCGVVIEYCGTENEFVGEGSIQNAPPALCLIDKDYEGRKIDRALSRNGLDSFVVIRMEQRDYYGNDVEAEGFSEATRGYVRHFSNALGEAAFGISLHGLVAAKLPARVTLKDETEVHANMKSVCDWNNASGKVKGFPWGDVLYDAEAFDSWIRTKYFLTWMIYALRISNESQQLPFSRQLLSFLTFHNLSYMLGCLIVRDLKNFQQYLSSYGYNGVTIAKLHNFIWDPGQNVISSYILEDKDVFERVGKRIIPRDITWVIMEGIKNVQNNCIIRRWCERAAYLNSKDGYMPQREHYGLVSDNTRTATKFVGRLLTVDVGTNNEDLLKDEFYIRLRRRRATSPEYAELLHEILSNSKQMYGEKVLIEFEDFAVHNAFKILAKYGPTHLFLNNDIHGIAFVILAGLKASLKLLGRTFSKEVLEIMASLEFDVVGLFWIMLRVGQMRGFASLYCDDLEVILSLTDTLLSILGSSSVAYKMFEIEKCNQTAFAELASQLQMVSIDVSKDVEEALKFNGATMDDFVWDPGLVWAFHLDRGKFSKVAVNLGNFVWDPGLHMARTFLILEDKDVLKGREFVRNPFVHLILLIMSFNYDDVMLLRCLGR